MIRVGFILTSAGATWTGGLNYFKNLLRAIAHCPDRRIQPVLITAPDASAQTWANLPGLEVVHTLKVQPNTWSWRLAKASQHVLGRSGSFEAFLRHHHIDVLSHSGHLGRYAGIPTIAWIPDFQHHHLPDLFSTAEQAQRNARFTRLAHWCTTVVVSSQSARADMLRFYPRAQNKCRVLRFVSEVEPARDMRSLAALQQHYCFNRPYFHLPNQFWTHKNHRVVIDALQRLRQQGQAVLVLATGHTEDRRHPDFFPALMAHAQAAGVADDFRVLGLVPYADLRALMQHSMAVINPSLFEGWSTSVEEGKSLGKTVVLSDIPVHREQAPERAHYFAPHDAQALAEILWTVQSQARPQVDRDHALAAHQALPLRLQAFAKTYQNIVLETTSGPPH